MPRLRLTARGVETLVTEKNREEFWDTVVPGLILRVSKPREEGKLGHKTWYVRYRANGTRRRQKVGTFPRTDLAKARERAREVMEKADAGEDPAREREEQREGLRTFRAMARDVLDAPALRRKTRERTQYERERILERELLRVWANRDAGSITRREVVGLTDAIAKRGTPVAANRTLALIRLLFNKALDRDFPGVEFNPAHRVEPPGEEEGRDRWLDREEIRAFWNATEEETPRVRGSFRLALLTGQRIGSIVAMRWDAIVGDLWTIPKEDFKGKRTHLVPLSAEALAVLDTLRDCTEEGVEYVFPSRVGSKVPHMANVSSSSLPRVRKRTGIPHWTLHDLRTTFRTWATRSDSDGEEEPGLGLSGFVADAVLGHKEDSLGFDHYTGSKTRYLLVEKRDALNAWGRFVLDAVEGSQ